MSPLEQCLALLCLLLTTTHSSGEETEGLAGVWKGAGVDSTDQTTGQLCSARDPPGVESQASKARRDGD